MTKRMLIDASHAEETRVVVLDGNRLEDFDVETATKRQLKGNIYLAKVVRVEPSLQAAFVEYGGNRHGFLAFSEIHPDYYQIPVADRQRLIEAEAEEARREEEEADLEMALDQGGSSQGGAGQGRPGDGIAADADPQPASDEPERPAQALAIEPDSLSGPLETLPPPSAILASEPAADATTEAVAEAAAEPEPGHAIASAPATDAADSAAVDDDEADGADIENGDAIDDRPPPETVGGDNDSGEERSERRLPSRLLRSYKIQEVIRRRQILLIQVVKEERGTKGAALTTYLSLAGRFSVLMPNSPRGGGISRKITSATDRRRLKEVTAELELPKGMGLIVRTAGANRPKPEIKRDCEYLLRLWDDIREHTMKSVAPALIYEEASLIKRTIRDVYARDVDEVLVDGEDGWRAAHDFMRMLMPAHAKKVQLWREGVPLFARHQVEAQLDAMLQPTVQLRSGGYLVINQAEALVAIDVNSGRSTRERGIEETALRTNMEAADEVARQLRLRDLAGLIVIDFIDMESKKNNAMVERRIKEALKNDRARIQLGHISHFGLMEMSRQRLRPSLAETSFIACPHCGGSGHVRSTESAAIHVLRGVEDEGGKRRAAEIVVHVATPIALYLLNHKRERLREIEARYAMRVIIAADESQLASAYRIDRVRPQIAGEALAVITPDMPQTAYPPPAAAVAEAETDEEEAPDEEDEAEDAVAVADEARPEGRQETAEDAEGRTKRRRRRRRGGRREDAPAGAGETGTAVEVAEPAEVPAEGAEPAAAAVPPVGDVVEVEAHVEGVPEHAEPLSAEDEARNRRRGRRGGRRRRREPGEGELTPVAELGAEQPELPPIYTGPTPANPFGIGGQAFDIFDVLEQAEQKAAARPPAPPAPAAAAAPVVAAASIVEPGPVAAAASIVEPVPATAASSLGSEPALFAEPAGVAEPVAQPEPVTQAEPAAQAAIAAVAEAPPVVDAPVAVAAAPEPVADTAPIPEAGAAPVAAAAPPEPSTPEPSLPVEPVAAAAEPTPAVAEAAAPVVAEPPVEIAATMAAVTIAAEPPVAANDATSEPAIKPIVIGSADAPPVEKKRGWWRR